MNLSLNFQSMQYIFACKVSPLRLQSKTIAGVNHGKKKKIAETFGRFGDFFLFSLPIGIDYGGVDEGGNQVSSARRYDDVWEDEEED